MTTLPETTRIAYLDQCRAMIADKGWMVQAVAEPGAPLLAYTCGLTGRGLPELIVMRLKPTDAALLLNHVAHGLADGSITVGQSITVAVADEERRARLVVNDGALLNTASALYGAGGFTAVEVVLPVFG